MRILITGGCGYIGSLLTRKLSESHDVVVFDNLIYNQGPLVYNSLDRAFFYNEDVLDWSDHLKDEVDHADVIIPLAALVGAPLCDRNVGLTQKLNYDWIEQLSERVDGQTVLFPNSNSGYGSTGDSVCTESTPSKPISHYGRTKQDAEEVLLKNIRESIVFRLATVFGWSPRPRLDLLINSLCMEGLNKGKIVVFDGHFRRNYVHVNDVVNAFVFAINNRHNMFGEVYNLGNDSINMTKKELAETIAEHINVPVEFDESKTDPDKRDYLVSSEKLKKAGFTANTSLEYGIDQMVVFNDFITDRSASYLRNY